MSKARQSRTKGSGLPMALAMLLATVSILGVGILYFAIEYSIPNSSLRTFFDLVLYNNTSTLPGTDLYRQLSGDINREMALFADPIAYLTGGIVFARTVSRRYSQRQVYLAGGGLALAINISVLAILWGGRLISQHGHLAPDQIDAKLELMQTLLGFFWIGVAVIGVEIGLRWRRASDARAQTKTAPAARASR